MLGASAVSAAGDPAPPSLPGLIGALDSGTLDEAKRAQLQEIAGAVEQALGMKAIPWRSIDATPLMPQTPTAAAATIRNVVGADEKRHVVVQFAGPVDDTARRALSNAGLELQAPLGNHAFFALARGNRLDQGAIAAVASLQLADRVHADFKLHRALLADTIPEYAITGQMVRPGTTEAVDRVAVYAVFHRDVALADAAALIETHGGVVKDDVYTVHTLVVELPRSEITALANEDSVQWIEPPLPRMGENNESNRVITQVDDVQSAPYNLDGTGINVLVYDGGTALESHGDFGGRLTVRDSSGTADHATHVAGTVGGDGSGSGGTNRGMAPNVTIQSYGFEYDGSGIFLYSNPGDIQADYDEAIYTYGAEISNNSIGSNVEPNGFPCELQGDYGVTSALIDAIVGGSLGDPFRIVWAAGNERQGSFCDVEGYGDYYSLAPPSAAKNHISVGALNSNDDSMTGFSSWGPADDGRLKPDISAPGCQSNDDNGVTSTSSSGGYSIKCGTSMASPTVCGMSALIMQDFKVQYPGQTMFRNSTLKTWLAHTAIDNGNPGPDYQFGYGSVRVQDAIDFMRTGAFVESSVTQGATFTRTVVVDPGDPELKVTLAWDDVPGTPNVSPALVNDLDLRVFAPGGGQHYPWTLDPSNPGDNAVQNQADHLNNIEQVLVSNPAAGTWTIEVYGFDVPQGPQSFSVVGDGAVNSGLFISFPNGLPATAPQNTTVNVDVQIAAVGESIVGTPTLHFRNDGGSYQTTSLTPQGGGLYQATLPASACGQTPEYYFSAQGTVSGVVTQPSTAPTEVFTYLLGSAAVLFADDFETDTGWTAENLGASSGDWQRGVPVDDNGWDHDPESDSDGSGQCLLTQNETGNTDVDDGAVRITSPSFDLSGGGVTISYDYFLRLTNTNGVDQLLVEMSSNGLSGPWTTVAVHDSDGGLTWRSHIISQTDLDTAGVTMTSTMRLRYTTNDGDPQSINESGVDAFRIDAFTCSGPPIEGACCFDDGSCSFGTAGDCSSAGGTYQGDDVTCAAANCEQPGACCFDDGSCTFGFAADCAAGGGTYQGDNVTCAAANCEQPGACCHDDGSCTYGFVADCVAAGGTYQGDNIDCAAADCEQPGGCCFDDGSCTFGFVADCTAAGGTYQGDNVTCAAANCEQPGACCVDDGSCTFGFLADCVASGGTYQGDNVSCASADCEQPGACCLDDGSCTYGFLAECVASGGTYQGDNVSCASANCEQPGACCLDDGSCTYGFVADCVASGGTYQGDNISCASANCEQPGACCLDDGSCTFGFLADCVASGGTYQGDNIDCATANCEQPGACCRDDRSCTFGFVADCVASGGTYQGDNIDCAAADCEQPGACCLDDGSCSFGSVRDCIACGGSYQG
ncbi:MAG: S8 family serine peptidase, partial [Planctomycetes bacterium]|nr:S8 family serine peptidase [Planctomycetota bacterium]